MTLLYLLRRLLGWETCRDWLVDLRAGVELSRSRGRWDEEDERLAELLKGVDTFLAETA